MEKINAVTSDLPLPPGSYGLPFLGETIAWRRDPLNFLRRRYECYGRIFKCYHLVIVRDRSLFMCQGKDYDWSLLPDQDLRASYSPTNCPKDGLRLSFKAREKGTDRATTCPRESLPLGEG